MDLINYLMQFSISVVIFAILVAAERFLIAKIKDGALDFINPHDFFPEEELKSLKQVYYLITSLLIFVIIVNFFFDNDFILSNSAQFYVINSFLDIIVSVHIVSVFYDKSSNKSKLLVFFLMPIASIAFLLFGPSLMECWDILRVLPLLYVIKFFLDKFRNYTDEHGLGFSIMLLFSILFVSFLLTMFFENEDPIDAMVMISNAFTSNGYAILGNSVGGRLNSIFLVWSGYILSGAATATLTAAILMRQYKDRINKYSERLDDLQASVDELKGYDDKLDDLQASVDELKGYDDKLDDLQASINELKK